MDTPWRNTLTLPAYREAGKRAGRRGLAGEMHIRRPPPRIPEKNRARARYVVSGTETGGRTPRREPIAAGDANNDTRVSFRTLRLYICIFSDVWIFAMLSV